MRIMIFTILNIFFKLHREIDVLSSSYFYSGGLKTLLKLQYKVDDEMLSELLLSPRARHNLSSKEFSCCDSCYSVLQELKFRKKMYLIIIIILINDQN